MSESDDYERLVLNLEIMGNMLKANVDNFNALTEAEQNERRQASHAIDRAIASRFSDADRLDISRAYCEALRKSANPGTPDVESESEIFVRMLESWGRYAIDVICMARQAQERRKEMANSFVLAFSKMLDTANALDDAALGYLLSSGFEQVAEKYPSETIPKAMKNNSIAFMALANDLKTTYSDWVRSFSAGMAMSLKALPHIDRDSSSPEFVVAAALEDYLGRRSMPFSTTETGLAGKSLHAVMRMAGIELGKAGYWLDKAKRHTNSWASFAARMKERNTP